MMSRRQLLYIIVAWLAAIACKCMGTRDGALGSMECPKPWTIPTVENGTVECSCGSQIHGVIECHPELLCKIKLLYCHCMSYSTILNTTVVGYCLGMCSRSMYRTIHACNMSELDDTICGRLHRTGQMCGDCKKGYAPPVYSYDLACVECSDYKYNWLKYIAVAFLPLTFFYVAVVVFRIGIMSRELQAYVLICQLLSAPGLLRFLHLSTKDDAMGRVFFRVLSTIYGIWNLDFFRSLYPPFCLHPKLTTLHILVLDYAIAVYPMLLILITYVCILLHDHSRLATWLWSPFHKCMVRFRREWLIRQSLIDVFALFLILSYVKILSVSYDILAPTNLFDVYGHRVQHLFVYFDGTTQYLKGTHVYFAALALTMTFTFNIIPLILLAVYPSRCFQKVLNHFQFCSHTLIIFMDTFQGNFKAQPCDCRYFAAFYLFLRMVNLSVLIWSRSGLYFYLSGYIFIFATLVVAVFRPYPKMRHTMVDIVLLSSVSLASFWYSAFFTASILDPSHCAGKKSLIVSGLLVSLPAMYAVLLHLHKMLPRSLMIKLKALINRSRDDCHRERNYQYDTSDEHIPILP